MPIAPNRPAAFPGMELLDRDTVARLAGLEFITRGRVAGAVSGRHRSPFRGFSAEFAEHREYVPGDDPRYLDWKVLARSDRFYIKRYMDETNVRVYLLVDASGSMAYSGDRAARVGGAPLSKLDYARRVAAALAWLFIRQQDAVGLAVFDHELRRFIPPRSRPRHLRVLLEALSAVEPGGETMLAPVLHDLAERAARRSLVIVVSDLFDEIDPLLRALQHFRYRKHETVVLHVMAEEEQTFPFDDWSVFEDLEHADFRLPVDPWAVRAAYLDEVTRFLRQLQVQCGRMHIEYVGMPTREPVGLALSAWLAARRNLVR